mgnify:CR=1 FL=1
MNGARGRKVTCLKVNAETDVMKPWMYKRRIKETKMVFDGFALKIKSFYSQGHNFILEQKKRGI